MFTIYDTDRDGSLTLKELSALLDTILSLMFSDLSQKETQRICEHAFISLDKDYDHKLSFEEFAEFTKELPTMSDFLRLQSQSALERWMSVSTGAQEQHSKSCPIQ